MSNKKKPKPVTRQQIKDAAAVFLLHQFESRYTNSGPSAILQLVKLIEVAERVVFNEY